MTSVVLFRSICFATGVVLAIYAGASSYAETTRPGLRAADFYGNGPRSAPLDNPLTEVAARISLNGEVLADYAAVKAEQATLAAHPADQAAANQAAERALVSALTVSPIRSTTWLMLGTLKSKMNQPAAGPLKMSYLTGPVPLDAAFSRIQTVTTTSAATDEDIRLLAQSDVRSFLTRQPRFDSGLVAIYVQATPAGKTFLLDATQAIDPKFSAVLRRY